jgi:fructuronate reductase
VTYKPVYTRSQAPGVVHLGLGAFHRAHQAMVFDTLLQQGDPRWGVLGVAMHNPLVADALARQDGLYAVQIADRDGVRWQVVGSVLKTCVASQEPDRVTAAIAAPATRWITLTVTEKGYGPRLATLLVRGLAQRQAAGLGGLTIASCDNLSHNGDQLRGGCLAEAAAHGTALAGWIDQHCTFPNSMVDRIVPAATPARLQAARAALGVADQAALGTEGFWEWVIERRFVDDADARVLQGAGVTVVDDVAPFEEAKLRMLNASHSAMACIGAVAGLPVISDCIGQSAVHAFIRDLMTLEVAPQMRRTDCAAYRDALLQRFANPALQHSVHQIATDSSQKIPQRWVPSALGALQGGLPFERLAFAAAAWIRYLQGAGGQGVDERGAAYTISDPLVAQLQALVANTADAAATVRAVSSVAAVWGSELPLQAAWQPRVAHWLTQIKQRGMLPALIQLNKT